MEIKCIIASSDTHQKPITCIAHHLSRREIFTGSEDASICSWDDNGRLTGTFEGHQGWVTSLVYCKEIKCLVSGSQDGTILVWANNGKVIQVLKTGNPVHSLVWNSRRLQLMCGQKSNVRVYQANDDTIPTRHQNIYTESVFDCKDLHIVGIKDTHSDIVNCLVSSETRFYSGGYDRKIVIYESPPHRSRVHVITTIQNAHDAAISCMTYARDPENAWIITGSFDRTIKLWSVDGVCLRKFSGFLDSITGLAYVQSQQSLWVTANSFFPIFFDPRSGVNVCLVFFENPLTNLISDFVKADNEKVHDKGIYSFKQVYFLTDTNEVVAITGRRQIVVWRFNITAPITTVKCLDAANTLTGTNTEPILLFSAGINSVVQWEQMQLNAFMYAREQVPLQSALSSILSTRNLSASTNIKSVRAKSHNKKPIPDSKRLSKLRKPDSGTEIFGHEATLIATTAYFYDPLNCLIVAFEERRVGVWGYEDNGVIPDENSTKLGQSLANESFANRVSGLTLKYLIDRHRDSVTSIGVCLHEGVHYLLTSGWDRRILTHDLATGAYMDAFRGPGREELVADSYVFDLSVRPGEQPQFAYASADKLVYVRHFSVVGDEMTLVGVLHGHEAEVNRVLWNKAKKQWVTGSEDKSVRMWDPYTLQCVLVVNNESPVTCMCLDITAGLVITGARDRIIRVFDGECLVQRNCGHMDEIRAIIHIASRKQYVSTSWDDTMRIWNAYNPKHRSSTANYGHGVTDGSSGLSENPDIKNQDSAQSNNASTSNGLSTKQNLSKSIKSQSNFTNAVNHLEELFLSDLDQQNEGRGHG